ncbi:MAG: glycosyltransferase family 2 protein [Mobilitalea sp.]
MPKISIIIPVYNTDETYLRKCLDSVAGQTFQDIQAIIVDDGSKNDAGKICDEYAEKFPIFKILHIKNQGVSNARNIGMKEALGEYLMFLDSDDWLDVNLCSNLVERLKSNTQDVLIFNYAKVIQDKIIPSPISVTNYSFKASEIKELQLIIFRYSKQYSGINLCTTWCKLYKTEMLRRNDIMFINGLKRAEDMLFNLNVLEYALDVCYYEVSGYFYRINDASESQSITPQITDLSSQIRGYLEEFIKNRKKEKVFYEALNAYCIENIFEQLYMYYSHDKIKLKEFYELLKREPFRTAHKKVKIGRLRYSKLQLYTLATRLHLRTFFILAIYYKNKTALRGRFFSY